MVETTDDLNKLTNALAPVLALTLGVSSKHNEYTVEADPAMFEQVAGEELRAANCMLIARFRQAADGIGVEPAKARESAGESSSPFGS
jgi:hypothetical protein